GYRDFVTGTRQQLGEQVGSRRIRLRVVTIVGLGVFQLYRGVHDDGAAGIGNDASQRGDVLGSNLRGKGGQYKNRGQYDQRNSAGVQWHLKAPVKVLGQISKNLCASCCRFVVPLNWV